MLSIIFNKLLILTLKIKIMKKLIIFSIIILVTTTLFSATITGNAFLDNQSNHSGITITFNPISPTAVFHQVISNVDGSFNATVENGTYNITYQKDTYQTYELLDVFLNGSVTLGDITLSSTPVIDVIGNVSGVWESGNTYKVNGDITIPEGSTLTIEPNVEVKFNGYYSLTVSGTLLAEGNEDNYITFTSNFSSPTNHDWERIHFINSTNSKSIMDFCIVEYAGGFNGMIEINSELNLSNSIIRNSEDVAINVLNNGIVTINDNEIYDCPNGIVLSSDSSSIIQVFNNKIYDIELIGINIGFIPNESFISCNIIRNCSYAGIQSWAEIIIEGNIISNNGSGLTIGAQEPNIKLNTFHSNTKAINLIDSFTPTPIINSNLFISNNIGIYSEENHMPSVVKFNAFYDNNDIGNNLPNAVGIIVGTNSNGTDSDSFFNIFDDPEILSFDYTDSDFCIPSEDSILRNAADLNLGEDAVIGLSCFGSSSVLATNEFEISESLNVYPNPTKDVLNITDKTTSWILYNTLGRSILVSQKELENTQINMSNLPEGVYFLKAVLNNGNVVMKKIIKN